MYNENEYFDWNEQKEKENIQKHGISFDKAIEVFLDPKVIHLEDLLHSTEEDRYFAIGKCSSGKILTVRYTVREETIRIFGVAYWRKWRKYYERENS